ncbi:Phage integrase family protein [Methylobacterium sp. 275MFSha3.1]|uniref:tyrosine-type recombinase/integrase n=1 Tax=Methylobacterium sp. 275MFSha3.1 TaxID=1502746 RepID=UPI0008A7A0FB|nr:site-specific integrase [Methylobacterium sp. 275MFSha3.1]SEI04317.1 Phage integrase family protein [Methylobacterium sp. 275MFSha3.1]
MRLTQKTVAHLELPPGKSDAIFFDETLPGFGVRLRAGGKRTWVAQYRAGGKTHRESLGAVGTVGLDEARAHARKLLASVQLGANPQAEKAATRAHAALTLGAAATRYLKHAEAQLRPRSFEEVERHLEQHWAPLRETPIHSVSRRDIAARLSEISTSRGPYAANRARATLSALFTWAMHQGEVEQNPVIATGKATEEIRRDRVLSEPEIAAVWHACGADDYGRIVRLLMLTGQRREEVGAMRWSELELTGPKPVWRLPAARTKNNLPHDVPLSDLALEILHSAPRRAVPGTGGADGRDLIFGEGKGAFQGWSKAKSAMDDRILRQSKMKIPPWRLHDLRRTMVTQMNELRILPHVVEAVVNHVTGPSKMGVAGIYNRAAYATEKREALISWAAHVKKIANEIYWDW